MQRLGYLIIAMSFALILKAQQGVTTFGVSVRPIFPLGIVNTDVISFDDGASGSRLTVNSMAGYSLGAVIRFGLTKRFSIETGIHYNARFYDFQLENNGFPNSSAQLRFPGYEIPLHGMVFVRLGQETYMTATAGLIFDLFPTGGISTYDRDTMYYGMLERNWVIVGLGSNLGFEWRSQDKGYFYIGASYHNTLGDLADLFIAYRVPNTDNFVDLIEPVPSINGNYLSLDFRYFFDPGKKKDRK